jgi:FkbM family methyltransferase
MQTLKRLVLASGLYRPARLLHRAINREERMQFRAGRALYRQFVRPGELCFDIGAYIGTKTEILLSLGARVVAVEPQPDLAREVTARGRHYGQNIIVVQCAISNIEWSGEVAFAQNEWTGESKRELAGRSKRNAHRTVSGALSPSCAVRSDPEDVADLDWIGSHIWLTI